MIDWVLSFLGLRLWHLIVAAVGAAMIPGAYFAGEYHQRGLDRVEDHIAALEAEKQARKDASDAAARLIIGQTQAARNEHDARAAIEAEKATLEDRAREKDRQLDEALNFKCPPAIVAAPAPAQARPIAGPPVPATARLSCSFDDDELARLRRRFPAGPAGQNRHPAASGRSRGPL